ncbi:MAG: MFS transporter [Patescibacteria group bacterium]
MFKSVNKVIYILVGTDFFYNSAFGAFAPIFAIFITGQIAGGSAKVAGFATASYWVVKSVFQLFIARFLDRTDGEWDEFWAVFLGYFFSGFVPLGYLFATEPWHLYALQGFLGFTMAWAIPAWYSIFTRHVDRWRIGFEWSLQSVFAVGISAAGSAALGGFLADRFGFRILFLASGILAIASSFLILTLRKHLLPRDNREKVLPERIHHR